MRILCITMIYDYARLIEETNELSQYVKTGYVGRSELGRRIPYLFVGSNNAPQAIICGSVHAREYITTSLVMMIVQRAIMIQSEMKIGVWFVPMVNPDGVELCQKGLSSVPDVSRREFLIDINGGSEDFSLYKANINGVDINNNFPARWGTDPASVYHPAPGGYIGPYPVSETETQAMVQLTERTIPQAAVAYHTKGQIIYWDFFLEGAMKTRFREKAEIVSASTGYPLVPNGDSVGGYKDWCIEKLGMYGYTIEVGNENLSHPIGDEALNEIYLQNKDILKNLEEILL